MVITVDESGHGVAMETGEKLPRITLADQNANEWSEPISTRLRSSTKTSPPIPNLPYIDLNEAHNDSRKLIGIDGLWYDITNFIPYHPGGNVIEKFVYKDSSAVFRSMHDKDVIGKRKPIGYYQVLDSDPAATKFRELYEYFKKEGYFETDLKWYARKIAVTFLLGIISVFILINAQNLFQRLIGGVILAAFWQQCGFHLHDMMHNQVTHNRKIDQWLGRFFGTTLLGLSASWWRDEHFIHHALTNTLDYETEFVDPQMKEPSWVQNKKLFPFYKTKMDQFFISIQHFTFLPICMFIGRPYIIFDALLAERRWYEWFASFVHFSWTIWVFSHFPTYFDIAIVYFLASSLQGILHVQLLLNHYAKEFFQLDEICAEKNWYRAQIECNLNIKNPVWLDWLHGGLNLHIEHHLYPTMPRHNFRRASVHIKKLCQELGIHYHELCLSEAGIYTLKHLKQCGKMFSLDPR